MSDPFADVVSLINKSPATDPDSRNAQAAKLAIALETGVELDISAIERPLAALAGAQRRAPATLDRPFIALFASVNGVGARIEDPRDQAYVQTLVANLQNGTAPTARVAQRFGAGVQVLDLASDTATPDIVDEDSLTPRDFAATFAFGMEALAARPDGLVIGAIAAGASLGLAALSARFLGQPSPLSDEADQWVAAALARRETTNSLDAVCAFGGRELAALMGTMVGARFQNCGIVLDGDEALMAACVLHGLRAEAIDHCIIASGADHLAAHLGAAGVPQMPGLANLQPGLSGALTLQALQSLTAIA